MKTIYGCAIMILKINNFLVSIILLTSALYSQSEIDDLINEVYSGNINNAKYSYEIENIEKISVGALYSFWHLVQITFRALESPAPRQFFSSKR